MRRAFVFILKRQVMMLMMVINKSSAVSTSGLCCVGHLFIL